MHLEHQLLSSSPGIRKDVVPDLSSAHRRDRSQKTRCSTFSDAILSICGVFFPLCDTPVTTLKRGFAQGVTVLHFRKVVNTQKIGSPENRRPVIYRLGYMSAYYQPENYDGRGKSSG